jgi:hypothetical protein
MISGDNHLNAPCDCDRVTTQGIDLHPLFEQRNPRSPMLRFERGEPLVDCARTPVKIVAAHLLGDPRQYRIDECVVVGAPLAPCDDIEGNFHGALQFRKRLLEIEHVRLQATGEINDRPPLQAGQFGCVKKASGLQGRDYFLFVQANLVTAYNIAVHSADRGRDVHPAALAGGARHRAHGGLFAPQLVEHEACHRAGDASEDRRGKGAHDRTRRRRHQLHQPVHKLGNDAILGVLALGRLLFQCCQLCFRLSTHIRRRGSDRLS